MSLIFWGQWNLVSNINDDEVIDGFKNVPKKEDLFFEWNLSLNFKYLKGGPASPALGMALNFAIEYTYKS